MTDDIKLPNWINQSSDWILDVFAAEDRVVISDWRMMVYLNRKASREGSPHVTIKDAQRVYERMVSRKYLAPLDKQRAGRLVRVGFIDVPFARKLPRLSEQIILEGHPWAILSHRSAVQLQRMSGKFVQKMVFSDAGSLMPLCMPFGTTSEDWLYETPLKPKRLLEAEVDWVNSNIKGPLGIESIPQSGHQVWVTTLERTLLDALIQPDLVDGKESALRLWSENRSRIRVDELVKLTELIGGNLFKQRVGYLMSRLDLIHKILIDWQSKGIRGGSSKLFPGGDYGGTFDANWKLGLNVPKEALDVLTERH